MIPGKSLEDLAKEMNITVDEARRIVQRFKEQYPKLLDYIPEHRRPELIATMFGRKRTFRKGDRGGQA